MKLTFPLPHLMEIQAMLQPWELAVTGPDQFRMAQRAEALGYDMIAIPEHIAIPPDDQHTGHFWLHSTTAQAALAGATSRILLNSCVTILPLQNPLYHAKALATADWFSGGRMVVTFGLGSIRKEFDYFGVPWDQRGAIADEYLDAIVAMRVVAGIEEAMAHITRHGSQHTDAIVTDNKPAAERFLAEVDSAIVLHNASTQFADGGEFGFGPKSASRPASSMRGGRSVSSS